MDLDTFIHEWGEEKCLEALKEKCGEDLAVKLAEEYAEPPFDEEAAIEKGREERLT